MVPIRALQEGVSVADQSPPSCECESQRVASEDPACLWKHIRVHVCSTFFLSDLFSFLTEMTLYLESPFFIFCILFLHILHFLHHLEVL